MAEEFDSSPYATAAPMFQKRPAWINETDSKRLAAYDVYDNMFNNVEGTYRLISRGAENHPVYVPTAKTVVKTISRYTAVSPSLSITSLGNDAAVEEAKVFFDALFKRERFWSKFASNKKAGIRRGDWVWHIVGNDLKPEGSRISIYALDPRKYFRLTDPSDSDRVVGCDITELVQVGDKQYVKVQRYTKGPDPLKPGAIDDGKIYSALTVYELENWEDPVKRKAFTGWEGQHPPEPLHDAITQLPVYHIRHNEETDEEYGRSELNGFERIIAAITQSTSDEELALALEGLGMYVTNAGKPVNSAGQEVPWELGPGRVVEKPPGSDFERVSGIGSLTPYQQHLEWIDKNVKEAAGITEAAIGKIDAAVAESGVALAMQLAPTLAGTADNDTVISEIMNQMLFDLKTGWAPAFEGKTFDETLTVEIQFGSKLPVNRKAEVQELNDMFDKGIIDGMYYRLAMGKFGYSFPENMTDLVVEEKKTMLDAVQDPATLRADEELAATEEE